jgi:hypothetical protein
VAQYGKLTIEERFRSFAHHETEIGYCHGLGLIVGLLLTLVPAEEAFWLLVAIVNRLKGWYSQVGLFCFTSCVGEQLTECSAIV